MTKWFWWRKTTKKRWTKW